MENRHLVQVRTICAMIASPDYPSWSVSEWKNELELAATFLKNAKEVFESHRYVVQTIRIATNALSHPPAGLDVLTFLKRLEEYSLSLGIEFLSAGTTHDSMAEVPQLLRSLSITSMSLDCTALSDPTLLDIVAPAILEAASHSGGEANFRLAAAFNCSGIRSPFFPVAHAVNNREFSIGLENSRLLYRAIHSGRKPLENAIRSHFQPIINDIESIAAKDPSLSFKYIGIDTSMCPGLSSEAESLVSSYELILGQGQFGRCGTLAISSSITTALKSLDCKQCGYSGLMLPVMEDPGLAHAVGKGLALYDLLINSAVCGCGLDTIPIPGYSNTMPKHRKAELVQKVGQVLGDIKALAVKLNKPLSVRLLPVPGGTAMGIADFKCPHLLQCKVMSL